MDGWVGGWMDGWMDEWMDEWIGFNPIIYHGYVWTDNQIPTSTSVDCNSRFLRSP